MKPADTMDQKEFEELRSRMIQYRGFIRTWPDRVVESMARDRGVPPEELLPILRKMVNQFLAERVKANPIPSWKEMVKKYGVDRSEIEEE